MGVTMKGEHGNKMTARQAGHSGRDLKLEFLYIRRIGLKEDM
jgi:hypothetical protein